MANIRVEVTGDKKIIKFLAVEFPDRLRAVITAALIESLKTAETEAIKLAPVKTGALRRSIGSVVATFKNNQIRAEIFAGSKSMKYAYYQEYGTYSRAVNPDSIKQVAGALRAGILPGGLFVQAKRTVRSEKGIQPKLYLHGGVYNAIPRMEAIFNLKLKRLMEEVNKVKTQ